MTRAADIVSTSFANNSAFLIILILKSFFFNSFTAASTAFGRFAEAFVQTRPSISGILITLPRIAAFASVR